MTRSAWWCTLLPVAIDWTPHRLDRFSSYAWLTRNSRQIPAPCCLPGRCKVSMPPASSSKVDAARQWLQHQMSADGGCPGDRLKTRTGDDEVGWTAPSSFLLQVVSGVFDYSIPTAQHSLSFLSLSLYHCLINLCGSFLNIIFWLWTPYHSAEHLYVPLLFNLVYFVYITMFVQDESDFFFQARHIQVSIQLNIETSKLTNQKIHTEQLSQYERTKATTDFLSARQTHRHGEMTASGYNHQQSLKHCWPI